MHNTGQTDRYNYCLSEKIKSHENVEMHAASEQDLVSREHEVFATIYSLHRYTYKSWLKVL